MCHGCHFHYFLLWPTLFIIFSSEHPSLEGGATDHQAVRDEILHPGRGSSLTSIAVPCSMFLVSDFRRLLSQPLKLRRNCQVWVDPVWYLLLVWYFVFLVYCETNHNSISKYYNKNWAFVCKWLRRSRSLTTGLYTICSGLSKFEFMWMMQNNITYTIRDNYRHMHRQINLLNVQL